MKQWAGIGVMSGTSLDGLDLAHVRFEEDGGQWKFEVLQSGSVDMDPKWYDRLYCLDSQSAETYARTNVYLGHFLGKAIAGFIEEHGLNPQFVACHGQTIFHQPDKNFTAQIGDGETIASFLEVPLVTNFRNKDVALGGQGAPLVPFGEKFLFPEAQLFLNLGGFANLTSGAVAFDVSPCNFVLNWLARQADPELKYDPAGSIAASGTFLPALGDQLDALPYFHERPPKSLGKEWVEANVFPLLRESEASIPDLLHTYGVHVAKQVGQALKKLKVQPQEMVVTGGGVHNQFLMKHLLAAFAECGVRLHEQADPEWVDYKEAIIFAFLGLQVLRGQPNVLSSVTGARLAAVCGSIHLPPQGGYALL